MLNIETLEMNFSTTYTLGRFTKHNASSNILLCKCAMRTWEVTLNSSNGFVDYQLSFIVSCFARYCSANPVKYRMGEEHEILQYCQL